MAELLIEVDEMEVLALETSLGPMLQLRLTGEDFDAQLSRDQVRRVVHVLAGWLEATRGERGSCFAVLEYNPEFLERITKVLNQLAEIPPANVH